MPRDLRDPQGLGEGYLSLRALGVPIEMAVAVSVSPYDDGPFMSNDPADHHSKTQQHIDHQEG